MVNINQSIFDKYKSICDDMISSNFGVNCELIYPSRREFCANCVFDTIGDKSANRYKHGGPQPFNFGYCPTCGGQGYKEVSNTEIIKLRVYYNPKNWIKITTSTNIDESDAQVIGFLYDKPKFDRADEIMLDSDQEGYQRYKFTKNSDSIPHGLGHDRYFVCLLKRV